MKRKLGVLCFIKDNSVDRITTTHARYSLPHPVWFGLIQLPLVKLKHVLWKFSCKHNNKNVGLASQISHCMCYSEHFLMLATMDAGTNQCNRIDFSRVFKCLSSHLAFVLSPACR